MRRENKSKNELQATSVRLEPELQKRLRLAMVHLDYRSQSDLIVEAVIQFVERFESGALTPHVQGSVSQNSGTPDLRLVESKNLRDKTDASNYDGCAVTAEVADYLHELLATVLQSGHRIATEAAAATLQAAELLVGESHGGTSRVPTEDPTATELEDIAGMANEVPAKQATPSPANRTSKKGAKRRKDRAGHHQRGA